MSSVSKIMDSEYEIMKVLWEKSPLMASEIFSTLSEKKAWSKSTVITLANRLVEKGALKSEKRGLYFYTPIVTEAEYTKYHANNFLKKIFKGNAKNLIAYFCDNEEISPADLEALKQIIEQKEV